jgi:muramoyltetrapeptide carboxypeptidase
LLPCLSVSAVRAAGKGLVGFSDITALHALWARAGVASLHAAMVAKVGDLDEARQLRWLRALEGAPTPALTGLSAVVPGRVEGRLVGGNLAVLAALVGTPFAPPLDGSVLFLEDIGERPVSHRPDAHHAHARGLVRAGARGGLRRLQRVRARRRRG